MNSTIYTAPRSLRGEYVHRKVIVDLMEQTCWSVRIMLPFPYEVHHADYNKTNNAPDNLIILSIDFHSFLTACGRKRRLNGRFTPKWRPVPEAWMPLFDCEDEVPF